MAELLETIVGLGGSSISVDRRPKLNERLTHRIVAFGATAETGTQKGNMTEIISIKAREILDSRGNPTVEADVMLAGGAMRARCRAKRRLHRRA